MNSSSTVALRTHIHRRAFLGRSTTGIGTLALASLLDPRLLQAGERAPALSPSRPRDRWTGAVHPLHFAPKVKRLIYLYMAGGPSHLETFDSKPELAKMHGRPMPESFTRGMPIAQLQGQKLVCFAPQHPFHRHGAGGQEISTIFPHIATIADEICIIRSMVTEAINHDPAHTDMHTRSAWSGRRARGSCVSSGRGSESDAPRGSLARPATGRLGPAQPISPRQWHSGFLPSRFQGVRFYSKGDPVLYLGRPQGTT